MGKSVEFDIMNKCLGLLILGLLALSFTARYAEAYGEVIQGPTRLVRNNDEDLTCQELPVNTSVDEIDCLCECYRRGLGWFWFYYEGSVNYCSCGGQFINGLTNPG